MADGTYISTREGDFILFNGLAFAVATPAPQQSSPDATDSNGGRQSWSVPPSGDEATIGKRES